ncbi:MAG: CocE/NonD family hydrolase [Gemmatimonadales bacterium]|nr:CocE/NonD family hydrolase [Gemmatimonadales bacterium]
MALVPKTASGPLPIILIRTPFGAAREFRSATLPTSLKELGRDGYIFVTEDVRGRFGSTGTFVTMRPMRDPQDPRATDESTDAFDTIDWLVKNLPNNNGRVGVLGISYRGWLAAVAGVGAHPALKAISPQGPMGDIWLGDDLFHQGAFRQTQAVPYAAYVETDRGLSIPDYDLYAFYLRHFSLDSLARSIGIADVPTWAGSRAHPAHDSYWDARALQNVLTKPDVPTLFVGGWWDPEDLLGPQLGYRTLEKADARGLNHIVLGPWNHGGWARPGGDSLGAIRFGSPTADYFREKIQRPWFAWWLHGTGDGKFPEAWAFEGGSNAWRTLDRWPPKHATARNIYLRENARLSFDAPVPLTGPAAKGPRVTPYDAWISDPAHPVPYVRRPDDGEGWDTWLVQDQRFVDNRPDVVTWSSEPLTEDLTIAGDVVAHLFASTSGTDADWVVKLIDVYPENVPDRPAMGGYELMVSADIMRGRYWKSNAFATPIPANTVTPFTVELHQQLYTFRKGHRLMVQVQSTWFPLYDRNPQTFVPNIFGARAGNFVRQEHRVWHSSPYPSHLSVSVIPTAP